MRDTALILYAIYFGLTVLQIILLLFGGMPMFDAICVSLGTAGTGGFGNWNDSIAHYNSAYLQKCHLGLYDPFRHQFQRVFSAFDP